MENESSESLDASFRQLTAACDANEKIAFETGYLLAALTFTRQTWKQAARQLARPDGFLDDELRAWLMYSHNILRASLEIFDASPDAFAPASPQLQQTAHGLLEYALPFNRIVGECFQKIEAASQPASGGPTGTQ